MIQKLFSVISCNLRAPISIACNICDAAIACRRRWRLQAKVLTIRSSDHCPLQIRQPDSILQKKETVCALRKSWQTAATKKTKRGTHIGLLSHTYRHVVLVQSQIQNQSPYTISNNSRSSNQEVVKGSLLESTTSVEHYLSINQNTCCKPSGLKRTLNLFLYLSSSVILCVAYEGHIIENFILLFQYQLHFMYLYCVAPL